MALQSEELLDCPYCGERVSILVDHSIPSQIYVEDCEVCCRPIDISCNVDAGRVVVSVSRADE
jgi:hypothetical protein